MRALITGPDPVGPDGLAELYAHPPGHPGDPARPWVRANMVAGADGAATRDGRSGGLGGEADRRLFALLRGLADAIVVGAGTVRDERYGPVRPDAFWGGVREGRASVPAFAVVTGSLDLDLDSPLFTEAAPDAAPVLLTTPRADPGRVSAARGAAEVIATGADGVDLPEAVARLGALGHTRLLCEGGPRLLAQLAADGLLDELCLTVSPLLTAGNAPRILDGPPMSADLELAHALRDGDFLFLRYLVRR